MEAEQYLDVLGAPVSVGDRVWTHYRGKVKILRLAILLGRKIFYYGRRRGDYDYVEFCHKPPPAGYQEKIDLNPAPGLSQIRAALLEGPFSVDAMRLKLALPPLSRKKVQTALEVLHASGEITKIANEYCYRTPTI